MVVDFKEGSLWIPDWSKRTTVGSTMTDDGTGSLFSTIKEIVDAFDFVSSDQMYEPQAFLNKATGEIHWYSELADGFKELPEDIDDEKYIEIPHKHEFDLSKNLVIKGIDGLVRG